MINQNITMPEPLRLRWNKYTRRYDISEDHRAVGDADLITITQAEAYADARVQEALTEVAEMCDNVFSFSVGDSVRDLMYKMLSKNNTTDKF